MERKACHRKGKESHQSRKDTLGSTPMTKNRGPKPNRNGMIHSSSSSDEDTSDEGTSSPKKASHKQQVVVEIHEPRTRAGPCIDSTKAGSSEANGIGPLVYSVGSQQTLAIIGNLRNAVEQNAILTSNASLDKNCFPQLPVSGSHSEDACVEKANKTEQQSSTSASSENVNTKHERGNGKEGFMENVFRSDCSSNSSSPRTPFENDSTCESDGETVIHWIGEKPTEVSADGGSDGSNSLLYSYPEEPQEDHIKVESKARPAPASGVVSGAQPTEDGGISSDAKGSLSKDICVKRDKRKEPASSFIVVDSGSNNLKALQQSPSAPVIIPAVRSNKCISQLLETPGCSIGSALSDCSSFVSASGSFMSGNSVQTFHTASSHHSTSMKNSDDLSDTLGMPQAGQLATTGDNDDQTDSHQSTDNTSKVLPISSSFVDVVCAVNRLASFVCHLCQILCPDESQHTNENVDDELKSESLGIKRRLCNRLFQVSLR